MNSFYYRLFKQRKAIARVESIEFGYDDSANVHRRHLTKGQQAMAIALAYPEPKRGIHSQLNNSTGDFDKASLSRARFVLRHCRDKAEEVLRNAKYPLTVAV